MSVSNPKAPEVAGVSVEHPTIREYIRNAAKQGFPKEHAMKITGMPMEVVDKHYREVKEQK